MVSDTVGSRIVLTSAIRFSPRSSVARLTYSAIFRVLLGQLVTNDVKIQCTDRCLGRRWHLNPDPSFLRSQTIGGSLVVRLPV